MIGAVIFDMDGVIIDSEPFWKEADIQAYAKVGLTLTEQMCSITTGLDGKEAVKYWYNIQPWTNRSLAEVKDDIEAHVVKCVKERGRPAVGFIELLDFLEERNIKIGLASASPMHIIEAVLDKLNVKHRFHIYHSSEFEEQGKPHPAVYSSAARMLNVASENCVVFEDSINGLKAAKGAGMKVVAIPDKHLRDDEHFKHADFIISSLSDFNEDMFQSLS
jgi:mannitol-1-/sugar-/sorbitol-6-/2-deoxyglucose-6-phosphatase